MRRVTGVIAIVMTLMVGVSFTVIDEVSAASKPSKVIISSAKSADYNAVKVTWKKAQNATSYQVYRATSKSGKYKKIKTTSDISYTNGKLTTDKKYYYKVRALNGSTKGSFSSVKSATPKLKTPSATTKVSKNSVKISWKKVNGAKGYQIYFATSKNGKYKRIKTTSATSYTNKKLKTGKKYYFKIRAYKNVNGKIKYSYFKSVSAIPGHDHIWNEDDWNSTTQTVAGYYVCHGCGIIEPSNDHMIAHINAEEPSSSHADTIKRNNVVTVYSCFCGATKTVEEEYYKISCAGTIDCREAGWVAPHAKTSEDIQKEHNECMRILEAIKQGQENIDPPMGVSIPKHTHRWWAEYATREVQVGTENAPIYETEEYISKFNCVCGMYCLWPSIGARVAARCEQCGDLDIYMVNNGGAFLCFRCR